MQNTQNLLSISHLKKEFPSAANSLFRKKGGAVCANDDINLEIRRGETFGLVGESGCGKSTFGRTVLQLYKPTSGSVKYYGRTQEELLPSAREEWTEDGGVELTKLSLQALRALRQDLQIVFQDPYSSLNPRMTVGQIIAEGAVTHGFYPKGSAELRAYVEKVMTDCGLQPYMSGRYPHQFSGGQRQRVCIARALAVKPKFVVCDECVSALDVSVQSQILNLLTELKEKEGLTYLFISHDLSVVRRISDRIAVMYLGKIVEQGSAEEIFDNPLHPYTIALISAIPSVYRKRGEGERILLDGQASKPTQGCPFYPRCFMGTEYCQRVPVPLEEVEKGHFAACHFASVPAKEKRAKAKANGKTVRA